MRIAAMAELAGLTTAQKNNVMEKLTLTNSKSDETLPLYKLHQNPYMLWVPRSHPAVLSTKPEQLSGKWPWTDIRYRLKEFPLRPHQIPLVRSYMDAINGDYPFGGILKARTGAGKTVVGCAIAAAVKLPTLVVVPTDYLMGQWKERILTYTETKESEIGFVRQDQCDTKGKKFLIGMLKSLTVRKYAGDFYWWPGLVIFDEIHSLGAMTFSAVAGMFHSKHSLGLSATPRRKDGMENVFLWHIGPVLATSQHSTSKVRARIVEYNGMDASDRGLVWGGKLCLGRYMNRLEQSDPRNTLIATIVFKLFEKDEHILVLSDRLRMLDIVKMKLIAMGVPKNKIGMFTSKSKQTDRQILLGTYGSAGTGADIPRLSSLVLATPRADLEQAVGRVMRDANPMVVDIIDTRSMTVRGWAFARRKLYRRIGADVKGGR